MYEYLITKEGDFIKWNESSMLKFCMNVYMHHQKNIRLNIISKLLRINLHWWQDIGCLFLYIFYIFQVLTTCIRYKNSKNVLHLIFLTFVSKQFQTCRKKNSKDSKNNFLYWALRCPQMITAFSISFLLLFSMYMYIFLNT